MRPAEADEETRKVPGSVCPGTFFCVWPEEYILSVSKEEYANRR